MKFENIKPETYDKYTFGNAIRIKREELGMSIRELSRKIGISAAYLSDIEKGNRCAPIKTNKVNILENLIIYLKVQKEELKYFYDMAYASRGHYKDIEEYINENANARNFIRCTRDLSLSNDQWEELYKSLEQINQLKLSLNQEFENKSN